MSTFILERPPTIAWELDGTFEWRETVRNRATKKRIEGTGEVSDYVAEEPSEYTVTGKVTACLVDPFSGAQNALRADRLQKARDDLVALAAKRSRVRLSAPLFTGDVVITQAQIVLSAEAGKVLDITITFQEIRTTTPQTTTVPAGRLRPKVKKRAGGQKGSSGASFAPRPGSDAEQKKVNEIVNQKAALFKR